jgi:hypothetical protein
MLSFTRGDKEVAVIKGGPYDKKILRIYSGESKKPDIKHDYPEDVLSEDYYHSKLGKKRYNREAKFNIIEPVRQAIIAKSRKNVPKVALDMYYEALRDIKKSCTKELILDEGILIPLPLNTEEDKDIEHIYVSGPTKSGKSTWIGRYIGLYKEMYPDNPVWLFSRLDADEALDKYKIRRISLDEGLLDNPMSAADFVKKSPGALVVFDDIDTIPDKDINKEVHRIRDDLLETGRHETVSVISTSHLIMNYNKTRNILNEASAVTFYPRSSGTYHIKRFLKVYAGLDNKMIEKVMNYPSRWITLYKNYPMYILHEKGALLLS